MMRAGVLGTGWLLGRTTMCPLKHLAGRELSAVWSRSSQPCQLDIKTSDSSWALLVPVVADISLVKLVQVKAPI